MSDISSSSLNLGEALTDLTALRNATLLIPFLSNVWELRICRSQMYIFPSFTAQ
uniref:hypothetical protein n=1 Tax=Alloprevotella sp. TaxID=1872471 RepID=UPI004025957A